MVNQFVFLKINMLFFGKCGRIRNDKRYNKKELLLKKKYHIKSSGTVVVQRITIY